MSDNLLEDLIEPKKDHIDTRLVEANTKLVDENKYLKLDLKRYKYIVDNYKEWLLQEVKNNSEYKAALERLEQLENDEIQ